MAQVFHRSTNTLSRLSIYGAVFLFAALAAFAYLVNQSAYFTEVNLAREQPVPFSHKHHVTEDGIDCRYCHTTVERSSFAGMPSTYTCMSCHSKIWVASPMLEPVRASLATDASLRWQRVYNLPGFVYFDHSIHVAKGIGCTSCHGPIGDMPITYRANTLYMRWCIECHNHPEQDVRPREEVFSTTYRPPSELSPLVYEGRRYPTQMTLGRYLVKKYRIKSPKDLTDCYTCHR